MNFIKSILLILLLACLATAAKSQQQPRPVSVDSTILATYTGRYLFETDTVKCTRMADSLFLTVRTDTRRLYATSNDTFYAKDEPAGTITFTKNDKGKIAGVTVHANNQTVFFPKIN